MRRIWNKKWVRTASCAVVCAVVLSLIALLSGGKSDPVTGAVTAAATPLRALMTSFAQRAEVVFQHEEMVQELEQENERLRLTIAQMEDNSRLVQELTEEVESLRSLMDMQQEHSSMELCQTQFITWSSTNYTHQFTISSGTKSGIEVGDAVITDGGYLVGTVSKVSRGSATVTTIIDADSSISVNIGETDGVAICASDMELMDSGLLRLSYIPDPTLIRTGDAILTRTGGSEYPEGLVLGHVAQVELEDTGLSSYAIVVPSVDFETLDTLYVVTDFTKPEE